MRRLPLALLLPLLACTAIDSEGDDGPGGKADDGSSSCAERVELEWVAAGDDVTEERIKSLNAYSARKLASRQCEIDKTLEFRGIPTEQLAPIAQLYRVEVGNKETCLNGGFLFANFDLEGDKRYGHMRDQVDMTIEFLKRFHEDINGVPTVMFDTITICPKEAFGEEFQWQGSTLYLNAPFTQFGGIDTFDARAIRTEKWGPGEHLGALPKPELLKLLWPLLDPAGSVMGLIKRGLGKRMMGLFRKLVDFKGLINGESVGSRGATDIASLRQQLGELADDNIATGSDDGAALADAVASTIASASVETLECLADRWSAHLSDPSRWTAAAEAGISAAYQVARRSKNVKVKQEGLIVVNSTDVVTVNVDLFFSSGYQDIERYVEVVETEADNIELDQTGLIVVGTVDDIDINISITADKALPSAGLEAALADCR